MARCIYKKLGKKIDSKVMMAVFTDSMGDVITTSATILSLVIFRLTGLNIDGIVGIGVALVVMWAGVGIAKGHAGASDRRSNRSGRI